MIKHLNSVVGISRINDVEDVVSLAPGRIIESMQCHGRIMKGRGRMCNAKNKRSKFCQAHLNCYQNLRITNSKIPNAGLGLFCGNRLIKRIIRLLNILEGELDCVKQRVEDDSYSKEERV